MLYLKRPRVKSGELRRCGGALQIQRLEGSRPAGLWDLYLDEPVLILCLYAIAVRANARHRTSVRAEARVRFEAGDVDSSGAPDEMRRRSQEELGGGEALDNMHGSAAERTVPC